MLNLDKYFTELDGLSKKISAPQHLIAALNCMYRDELKPEKRKPNKITAPEVYDRWLKARRTLSPTIPAE